MLSSFGRGSLAQKNAEEGTGLGLPIVKGLVELHGGEFRLNSTVRVGTEVIVIFPPERVMDALPALDPEAPPRTRPNGAGGARAGRAADRSTGVSAHVEASNSEPRRDAQRERTSAGNTAA